MAPTKNDIIRQIQQGKVKTALEGIVQLSGLARDKEVQQRCLLLQSQLSQLDANFGMGTFDQKTYQLEQNRITQAALDLVYMLPAVVEAPPQYRAQGTAYQQPVSGGSGWKTWGILLTGGIGVLVILVVVGLMMEQNKQTDLGQVPANQLVQTDPASAQMRSDKQAATESNQGSQPQATNTNAKLIGLWSGIVYLGATEMGSVRTQFMANNQYVSQAFLPGSGAVEEATSGHWNISQQGELMLSSADGEAYAYAMQWIDERNFTASVKDANTQQLLGVTITFQKQ